MPTSPQESNVVTLVSVPNASPGGPSVDDEADAEPAVLRRAAGPRGGEYRATDTGLVYVAGEYIAELSNFDAEIIARIDKAGRTTLRLKVRREGSAATIEVTLVEFESLRWIGESVPGAVLWPGPGVRGHLKTAITLLSQPVEVEVHEHLGWVRRPSGQWQYVHAAGLIDGSGHHEAAVDVSPPLDGFVVTPADQLPPRAILDLLDLAPDRVVVPMLASVVRAVMGQATYAVHLWGQTGTGKSQAAAVLAAAFFGPRMSVGSRLPASWSSTPNALEGQAHVAKDTILCVDDWLHTIPEENVDRLIRSAANAGGRARMGTPAKTPRALIVSTGEDHPRTIQSLLARLVTIHLAEGDVDWERLTLAQDAAARGDNAAWLAGFLRWCAPRLDGLRAQLHALVDDLRPRWTKPGLHMRSVDALAQMAGSWMLLSRYLLDTGSLDDHEVRALVRRGEAALEEVAEEQARTQLAGDPSRLLMHALENLLRAGRVQLAAQDESEPHDHVGWIRGDEVLIDPDAALHAVQLHLAATTVRLDLSTTQLGRRLREVGLITRVDGRGGRVRYAVRVQMQGQSRRVWSMRAIDLGLHDVE